MSLPNGSKLLNSIDHNNYNYLTHDVNGDPTFMYSWDNSYFSSKGKPLNNLTVEELGEQMLVDVREMLPERSNITTTIFEDYPDLLSASPPIDHSLHITEETDVWVTFIDEGAGYKNAFGYYLWIDDNGSKVILQNDDVTNSNGSLGNYNPLIIFPNGSLGIGGSLRTGGHLVPGHRRKLIGNLPNGKFDNVNVGFFLVPNGWGGTTTGVRYNNKAILYSDKEFNTGTGDNNVQAVCFEYKEHKLLAFEDIKRPGGDSDFNDMVLYVETNPAVDGNFVVSKQGLITSSSLKKDFFGLFVTDSAGMITGSNKLFKFTREMEFSSLTKRDEHKFVMGNLNHELVPLTENVNNDTVKYEYIFTSAQAAAAIIDNLMKLYVFKKEPNEEDETIIITGQTGIYEPYNDQTVYQQMVSLQHLEINELVSEIHTLEEITDSENPINLKTESNATVDNVYGNLLAWGDPHIETIFGTTQTIAHEGVFELFNDKHVVVNTECWRHPLYANHPNPDFREGTFMKFISLIYGGKSIIVNMDNLSVQIKENGILRNFVRSDNDDIISISGINEPTPEKHILLDYLNKDPDSETRFIYVKDHIFACTLIPSLEGELNAFKVVQCNKELLPTTSTGLLFERPKQLGSLC